MLLKINSIDEVGRFSALRHKGEQFSRLTLVFARNGYGKSTICSILRSASDNEPNFVLARRRLGATKETRIQTTWSNNLTVTFSNGRWNTTPSKVLIFDQEYIAQNIYIGEHVTQNNKRGLLPVILGEKGVSLAGHVLDLDREQRDLTAGLKRQAELVNARFQFIGQKDMLAFCEKIIPEDIDSRISNCRKNVLLAQQAEAVKQRENLKKPQIRTMEQFQSIATATVASLSGDAADVVKDQVERHKLGEHWDRWLKYGLKNNNGTNCPFCNQPLAEIALIDAYNTYFSEAFTKLAGERDAGLAELTGLLSDSGLRATFLSNEKDLGFWNTVRELSHVPTLDEGQQSTVLIGLSNLKACLEKKLARPLDPVDLAENGSEIISALAILKSYNSSVDTCRLEIEQAKAEANVAELKSMQLALAKWEALAAKSDEPLATATAQFTSNTRRKAEVELAKKEAQKRLIEYSSSIAKERQAEINGILENFGTNFRIAKTVANFVGREPNTDYAIEVNGKMVQVGTNSEIEPTFKTVLSAGDKATLALAFFITQVRSDPDLEHTPVVFDDPFNSQDLARQFETASQIRSIAGSAVQTIVLSHDPRFLWMIEKDSEKASQRSYQLLCDDGGRGLIETWSSEEEMKSLYVRQAEIVREYANHGQLLPETTQMTVHQSIRPLLEDYLKLRFPGRFLNSDSLVPMINKIEEAGIDDPLHTSITDLRALNEFTRSNMHGGGQVADPNALRAQTRRVVKILGDY